MKALSAKTNTLGSFLMLLTFYNEIKKPSDNTPGDIVAKILGLIHNHKLGLKPAIASFDYIL